MTQSFMDDMVEMRENLVDQMLFYPMDFTVLMRVNRVQYSFISNVPLQFVQSLSMELIFSTVMLSIGLLVVEGSKVSSRLLDQTDKIQINTVSVPHTSSHLDLVVSKMTKVRERVLLSEMAQVEERVRMSESDAAPNPTCRRTAGDLSDIHAGLRCKPTKPA